MCAWKYPGEAWRAELQGGKKPLILDQHLADEM